MRLNTPWVGSPLTSSMGLSELKLDGGVWSRITAWKNLSETDALLDLIQKGRHARYLYHARVQ
jgi:hypothetical protein